MADSNKDSLKWIIDVGASGDLEIQSITAVIDVMRRLDEEYDTKGLSNPKAAKKRVLEYVVARDGLK